MKKFVIAYMTFFDNELKQEIVEAEDALQAALSYLGNVGDSDDLYTDCTTLAALQEELFNGDALINVLEIKASKPAWGPGNLPPIGQLAMQ